MPKGKGYDVKDIPRGSGLFDKAARGIMRWQRQTERAARTGNPNGMSKKDLERGYSKPDGD